MNRGQTRPVTRQEGVCMNPSHPVTRRTFLGAGAAGLALAAGAGAAAASRKLVLIAGKPSHPPGMHEFHAGVQLLAKCLAGVPGLRVATGRNGWVESEQ